jgi:nicotinate-nucleotide adenylyltransferase
LEYWEELLTHSNGHIGIATYVLEYKLANEVWFMVSPQSPGEKDLNSTDGQTRLENVNRYVSDKPLFKCCDIEFYLPRPSYTYNTVIALKEKYPTFKFMLILGADQWQGFNIWYKSDQLMKEVSFLVFPRKGYDLKLNCIPQNVKIMVTPFIDISSTQIRQKIKSLEEN